MVIVWVVIVQVVVAVVDAVVVSVLMSWRSSQQVKFASVQILECTAYCILEAERRSRYLASFAGTFEWLFSALEEATF